MTINRSIIGLLISLLPLTLQAGNIIVAVDSTAQEVTLDDPGGVANGNCTLGEAILAANTRIAVDGCDATGSPLDTVELSLQPVRYQLDEAALILQGALPTASVSGLPMVEGDMIIDGNGATVSRNTAPNRQGLVLFNFGDAILNLEFRNLILEGGRRSGDLTPPSLIFGNANSVVLDSVVMQNFDGRAMDLDVRLSATLNNVQILGDGTGRSLGASIAGLSDSSPAVDISGCVFSGMSFSGLNIDMTRLNVSNAVMRVRNSDFSNNFAGDGAGLDIDTAGDGANIEITGNTFRNNFAGTDGGGLKIELQDQVAGNVANISLSDNAFDQNRAITLGGGFYLNANLTPVSLSLNGDDFSRNFARDGGALNLQAQLAETAVLTDIQFSDNVATNGGALWHELVPASPGQVSVRITRSAFLSNYSFNNGAAMVLNTGSLTIVDNSTFNGQVGNSGVIADFDGDARLTLEAVTLDNNSGRSILSVFSPGSLTFRNVVSTQNPDGRICNLNTTGNNDAGGNHFMEDTCTGIALGDPMLGPLQENGGRTLNQLPQAGSPLIDFGVAPRVERNLDQRGLPRVINGNADIGAVETGAIRIFVSSFEGS